MVSCTEFIPLYSELFKFLEQEYGKQEVIKYWKHVSDEYVLPMLGKPVKEKGIAGCYEYWSKSLNEEACDFTMVYDDEEQSFYTDMHDCPSKGMLNKLGYTNPYHDYCGHCAILYSRIIVDMYGFKSKLDYTNADKAQCFEMYYADESKLGTGSNIYHYDTLNALEKVISDKKQIMEFMSKVTKETPCARYDFGEEGYVNVIETQTSNDDEIIFETHKKYMDIHCLISGEEKILYAKLDEMQKIKDYDCQDDSVLYNAKVFRQVDYRENQFVLIKNDVGHCPCREVNAKTNIKKVIIKVKI